MGRRGRTSGRFFILHHGDEAREGHCFAADENLPGRGFAMIRAALRCDSKAAGRSLFLDHERRHQSEKNEYAKHDP
jgi:hypothetical protein